MPACGGGSTTRRIVRHPAATEQEKKERESRHLALLLHLSTCRSPQCPTAHCADMKGVLRHRAGCEIKASGGCDTCIFVQSLLQNHVWRCKAGDACPMPFCVATKKRHRERRWYPGLPQCDTIATVWSTIEEFADFPSTVAVSQTCRALRALRTM
ncbi:hypothetical protein ACHAXT_013108 [Thalassiosira profunda]